MTRKRKAEQTLVKPEQSLAKQEQALEENPPNPASADGGKAPASYRTRSASESKAPASKKYTGGYITVHRTNLRGKGPASMTQTIPKEKALTAASSSAWRRKAETRALHSTRADYHQLENKDHQQIDSIDSDDDDDDDDDDYNAGSDPTSSPRANSSGQTLTQVSQPHLPSCPTEARWITMKKDYCLCYFKLFKTIYHEEEESDIDLEIAGRASSSSHLPESLCDSPKKKMKMKTHRTPEKIPIQKPDWNSIYLTKNGLCFKDMDEKPHGFNYSFKKEILENQFDSPEIKSLWRYVLSEIGESSVHYEEERCKIAYELQLNVSYFDYLVRNGLPVQFRDQVFYWADKSITFSVNELGHADNYGYEDKIKTREETLRSRFAEYSVGFPSIKLKQPPLVIKKLYSYQLKAFSWMKNLELTLKDPFYVNPLVRLQHSSVLLDIYKMRFNFKPLKSAITVKGGILADEMGLGKSLVVLSLITENPCTLDYTANFDPFDEEQTFFFSRATLIVCPSHLCKQWLTEIEESLKPGLKVIRIATIKDLEKVTYRDVMATDIIITSFSFLSNKNYLKLSKDYIGERCRYSGRVHETKLENLEIMATECRRQPGILDKRKPVLELFRYHRVVCDEAHEVFKSRLDYVGSFMTKVDSTYAWYVTGTPFPDFNTCFVRTMNFLKLKINHPGLECTDNHVVDFVRTNLFCRNTKENTKGECNIPPLIEHEIRVTLSEVEMGLYQDAAYMPLRARQLCCHPQISDEDQEVFGAELKTLDEIRDLMLDHSIAEKKRWRAELAKANKRQVTLTAFLESCEDQRDKKRTQDELKRLENQVQDFKRNIGHAHASQTYFESLASRITQTGNENCPICLERIENTTVTECGHIFCYECIVECVKVHRTCPSCRAPLKWENLAKVVNPTEKEKLSNQEGFNSLRSLYGSKMAKLIEFLRETQDGKFIIFAEWDSLLQSIGRILSKVGIGNIWVKGPIHQRNNAIRDWKSPTGAPVILLSLDNAASGTNLTEATHVIFMHPVGGDAETAKAIESQAIGRAHRLGQDKQLNVVRMITENTIEVALMERNTKG